MIEIFISYSDKDRKKLRAVEKIINDNVGLNAIIIADKRQALNSLTDKVKNGIFECNYFLQIITKQSIDTQWLNQEIGFSIAVQKKIFPIVEKQALRLLKGFINKEIDLPYTFEGNKSNQRLETLKFNKVAKLLIDDILLANNLSPKRPSLENLFSGRWRLVYSGIYNGSEELEISDGNKYFAKTTNDNSFKHYFNLEDISIDLKKSQIKYTKVGIPPNTRRALGELKIVELGKHYEGVESNRSKADAKVSYFKIA